MGTVTLPAPLWKLWETNGATALFPVPVSDLGPLPSCGPR